MKDLQLQLLARFSELRDARQGSIFFVEHGLRIDELDYLRGCVRASLQSYPLESNWWDQHDLPLLVAATEVGYRYRGSGTDFWPLLEEELEIEFPAPYRQRIRNLFVGAAARFRGTRPPATAWTDAFHLIAWPIAHALLPIEFHRPFAMMLANLRVSIGAADDEALYRAVLITAPFPSARFATLLGDAGLVVSLTRSLLGERGSELGEEIIDRLSVDLEADNVARRRMAVARSIQRASRSTQGAPCIPAVSEIKGSLQLRRADGPMLLEAIFPPLDPDTAGRLRGSLRRRRFAPRLWGVTARVPSDQLLSGLPFALRLTQLPTPDMPLFPDLDREVLDPQDLSLLHSFQLRLELPLLFAVSADGDMGRHVRGNDITGYRHYWLLDHEDTEFQGIPVIGEVGPMKCLEIDPKNDHGARALAKLGYHVRFGVSVRFAGRPTIRREDPIPTFVTGEKCVLVPQQISDAATLRVSANGNISIVHTSEVVQVVVREGDQLVEVSNETDSKEYMFRGVESIQPLSAAVLIALRSEERTVQALLAGRLSFVVDGAAPLGGLQLTVDLTVKDKRFSATGPLEPLPQVISVEHPILKKLLDEDVINLASGAELAMLRAEVRGLAVASWELERAVRPCWWDLRTAPRLLSETGPLHYGVVVAEDPLRAPEERLPGEGAHLLAPLDLDPAEFGAAAQFTTLCLAPNRVQLELPLIEKPRLLRRRRGARSSIGLEDLVEAYLRWSLAETRTVIDDLRRGQVATLLDSWVAELCCGLEWSQEEWKLDHRSPWVLFERACRQLKLGHDSYIALPAGQYAEVRQLAIEEVRRSMSGLWVRLGPSPDLSAEDYNALDRAFASAYEELAKKYRKCGKGELAGVLDQADPGDAPEVWDQALGQVRQAIEMRGLAAMLLPSNCAQRFIGLDAGGLTVDEVADELSDWARSARMAFAGAPPTRDTLRAIYALWVEPELALVTDWRGALDTLLAERAVARATRYLAIKARDARRGAA